MKIAFHHNKWSFSERWINYCKENRIDYKIVNCYESNIIEQLKDCDALFWHHHHSIYKDTLFAKQLLYSLESAGIRVFPDFKTDWHFDDKLGQKYLLEAVDAPLAPSYVFYSKDDALHWAKSTVYPKVFKLRCGAGFSNVLLVKNKIAAIKLINKAFRRGFSSYNRFGDLKDNFRKYKLHKQSLLNLAKSFIRVFKSTSFASNKGRERGYVLFQDFMPNNLFDLRVVVVADKAFALKRLVRKNDFRASGSGFIIYEKSEIDERCVKIAFEVSCQIEGQCIAYDFVFDQNMNPKILEISYGFSPDAYDVCPGYWDKDLSWHEGPFNPYGWMIDNIIKSLNINLNESKY